MKNLLFFPTQTLCVENSLAYGMFKIPFFNILFFDTYILLLFIHIF